MIVIREVKSWKLVKDNLMGVTSLINEKLDFQSLWNTGSDAEEEIERVKLMSDYEFTDYAYGKIPLPF